jgi:hypothetical protein
VQVVAVTETVSAARTILDGAEDIMMGVTECVYQPAMCLSTVAIGTPNQPSMLAEVVARMCQT